MCKFLSLQKEKYTETFIYKYKNPDTWKKQDNLRYVFIDKKAYTLRYTIFHEILKLAFIYTQKAKNQSCLRTDLFSSLKYQGLS